MLKNKILTDSFFTPLVILLAGIGVICLRLYEYEKFQAETMFNRFAFTFFMSIPCFVISFLFCVFLFNLLEYYVEEKENKYD